MKIGTGEVSPLHIVGPQGECPFEARQRFLVAPRSVQSNAPIVESFVTLRRRPRLGGRSVQGIGPPIPW
jgi:hypothetical protein